MISKMEDKHNLLEQKCCWRGRSKALHIVQYTLLCLRYVLACHMICHGACESQTKDSNENDCMGNNKHIQNLLETGLPNALLLPGCDSLCAVRHSMWWQFAMHSRPWLMDGHARLVWLAQSYTATTGPCHYDMLNRTCDKMEQLQ